MTPHTWSPLKLMTDVVPASPTGLWTPVLEFVEGPITLKFAASGTWETVRGRPCGADGEFANDTADDALTTLAPIGTLIAKVGGGTADRPQADSKSVFAVGTFCVLVLGADEKGALFLTMNDRVRGFASHAGQLAVEVFQGK